MLLVPTDKDLGWYCVEWFFTVDRSFDRDANVQLIYVDFKFTEPSQQGLLLLRRDRLAPPASPCESRSLPMARAAPSALAYPVSATAGIVGRDAKYSAVVRDRPASRERSPRLARITHAVRSF